LNNNSNDFILNYNNDNCKVPVIVIDEVQRITGRLKNQFISRSDDAAHIRMEADQYWKEQRNGRSSGGDDAPRSYISSGDSPSYRNALSPIISGIFPDPKGRKLFKLLLLGTGFTKADAKGAIASGGDDDSSPPQNLNFNSSLNKDGVLNALAPYFLSQFVATSNNMDQLNNISFDDINAYNTDANTQKLIEFLHIACEKLQGRPIFHIWFVKHFLTSKNSEFTSVTIEDFVKKQVNCNKHVSEHLPTYAYGVVARNIDLLLHLKSYKYDTVMHNLFIFALFGDMLKVGNDYDENVWSMLVETGIAQIQYEGELAGNLQNNFEAGKAVLSEPLMKLALQQYFTNRYQNELGITHLHLAQQDSAAMGNIFETIIAVMCKTSSFFTGRKFRELCWELNSNVDTILNNEPTWKEILNWRLEIAPSDPMVTNAKYESVTTDVIKLFVEWIEKWVKKQATNDVREDTPAIYLPDRYAGPDILIFMRTKPLEGETHASTNLVLFVIQAKLRNKENATESFRSIDPNLWYKTNRDKTPNEYTNMTTSLRQKLNTAIAKIPIVRVVACYPNDYKYESKYLKIVKRGEDTNSSNDGETISDLQMIWSAKILKQMIEEPNLLLTLQQAKPAIGNKKLLKSEQ
jgi:hypothetical protein